MALDGMHVKNLQEKFSGIIPAVVSPHNGRDEFLDEPFERHIDYLWKAGISGLYLCGGTGQGYLLRIEERKKAVEIAVKRSPEEGVLIAHVGAQSTPRLR